MKTREQVEKPAKISENPQDDSPGDTGADSEIEVLDGMEHRPKMNTHWTKGPVRPIIAVPDTAIAVSSDSPSSWSDRDSDSDTH